MVSDRVRLWLTLTPALSVILLLFVGGVLVGFGQSLGYLPLVGLHTPTLRHYVEILSSRDFYISLLFTLYFALASTLLSMLLAVGIALVLRERFAGSRWMALLFQLPLPVPHLVAAAGIVMLLSQSGLVARLLYALGGLSTPAQFPVLVFDRWSVGAILVYVWKETPFIGLVVLATLKSIGQEYEEVARTLGASRWQCFRYVLLPLIGPGLISTSVIVFAFTFGSFEVPLLLGQRYPNVLPVRAYQLYNDPDLTLRPAAMAEGMVITMVIVLLLAFYRRLARGVAER
jgi:putative spermidine/putrescine transport system permease protein